MGDNKKDMTIGQFLGLEPCEVKINTKDFSILIGNGLGKSHPKYSQAFEFDADYVLRRFLGEIKTEYWDSRLMGVKRGLKNAFVDPEHFFQIFRVEMLMIILQYYIDELKNAVIFSKSLREKLLKKFNSIFTLNYDPIIYWNMLSQDLDDKFIDGLYGSGFIELPKLRKRMEDNKCIPVYYMHGAFHIFESQAGQYYKVKATDDFLLLEVVDQEFQKVLNSFRRDDNVFPDVTCVISSHSIFKEVWIDKDKYLSFCMDQFKKSKKLLIFGCSLRNDGHILRAIKDSSVAELYVCYKEQKHKESLMELIEKSGLNEVDEILKKPIIDIKYIDSSKIADIIWDDNKGIEF